MKRIKYILLTLIALAFLVLSLPLRAQTVTVTVPVVTVTAVTNTATVTLLPLPAGFYYVTNGPSITIGTAPTVNTNPVPAPTLTMDAQQLVQGIIDNYTNLYIIPYAVYAPSLSSKFGGGVGIFYPVNDYLVVGGRGEWLNGGLYGVGATVQLQLPIHPLKAWTWLTVTPLVYAGVAVGVSGRQVEGFTIPGKSNSGDATALTGIGIGVGLWKSADTKWGLDFVGARETRGNLDKPAYLGGLAIHHLF